MLLYLLNIHHAIHSTGIPMRKIFNIRKAGIVILVLMLFLLCAGVASASTITVTNPTPANAATGVTPDATLDVHAWFNSSNGSAMMTRCWTNCTGVFVWSNWAGPGGNNTVNWQIDASDYSTKYWWGVYANDSYAGSKNQTFTFTTSDAPVPPQYESYSSMEQQIVIVAIPVLILVALFALCATGTITTPEGFASLLVLILLAVFTIMIITS
jgi:hypothetical protein